MKYVFILCFIAGLSGCASLSPHSVDMCDELARLVDEQEIDRMKSIDVYINFKRKFTDKWMNKVTIPTGIMRKMEDEEFCNKLKNVCEEKCIGATFLQGFMVKFMAAVMRSRINQASKIDKEEADFRSRARIQFAQYRSILNALRANLKSYLKAKQLRQELTKKMGVDTEKFEKDMEKATKKAEKFYEVEDE